MTTGADRWEAEGVTDTGGSAVAAAPSERCSARSIAHGEPMLGTASTVRNWLLIEDPGPWGASALLDSRLPDGVGERLTVLSRELGIRVLLIRRHGRSDPRGCRVIAAHSGQGTVWIERGRLDSAADVFDLDLAALGRSEPVGLDHIVDEPVYLVCSHGRRDVCCAEKGRPVAAALAAVRPDQSWECSHIGGDRFAANLVCLPHGLYYGRVGRSDAASIADDYARGSIDLDHYRGRSCYDFAVQAAEWFLRRDRGLTEIDDLRLVDHAHAAAGQTHTRFTGPRDASYVVRVRAALSPEPRRLTCRSQREERPPAFELLEISMHSSD